MLTNKEKSILKTLNIKIGKNKSCLIEPKTLVKRNIKEDETESVLKSLENKDFLDYVKLEHQNALVYCVTLNYKGKNYNEEKFNLFKNLPFKLLFAVVGGALSFVIGRIFYMIFS